MSIEHYNGTLTDLGESPFPEEMPLLYVTADRDTFSEHGPMPANKRVYVPINHLGQFSIGLTPSGETRPPVKYQLVCEWLSAGEVAGMAVWEFTAYMGGGPIGAGSNATSERVWVGPPWPPAGTKGMYFSKETNDWGVV